MKYFIVCNNPPQGILPVASGPGMRARQLHVQISAAGHQAQFLMFAERYLMTCGREHLAHRHRDLQLIPIGQFQQFADRIDPATFVFTQANFPVEVEQAKTRHRIVFDCIARKDLELDTMGKLNGSANYLQAERVYVDHADAILATSPKLMRYLKERYGRDALYTPFAFAPEQYARAGAPTIAFGGRLHQWTDCSAAFEGLADYFEGHPDHRGMFFYVGDIKAVEDRHAKSVGRLLVLPNVTKLGFLPFRQAAQVVGGAHLFVDSTAQNAERAFATSIRTIHAISLGTPVYHNAGTGLDEVYPEFPGRLGPAPDAATIGTVLEQAMSGGYETPLAGARAAMIGLLTEEKLPW